MPKNRLQTWRLIAGEWDSMITIALRIRKEAAKAGLMHEVAYVDGWLGLLQYTRRAACLSAGYEPPDSFSFVDEEADTLPELETLRPEDEP